MVVKTEGIEKQIDEYKLVMMLNGLRDEEYQKSIDDIILSLDSKKSSEKKLDSSKKKNQLINKIFLDEKQKKVIVSALQKFEKRDLSFIPSEETSERFIKYYESVFNDKVKYFFSSSLPAIYKAAGIKTEISSTDYENYLLNVHNLLNQSEQYFRTILPLVPKTSEGLKTTITFSFSSLMNTSKSSFKPKEYNPNPIRYMDDLPEFIKGRLEINSNSLTEEDKNYLINLLIKAPKGNGNKGVNLVFYAPHNQKQAMNEGLPLLFSHKTKDRQRLSSKIRENLLNLYDQDDKNSGFVSYKTALKIAAQKAKIKRKAVSIDDIAKEMSIPFKEIEVTDYVGMEIVVPEGLEEKYKEKLLSLESYSKGKKFILIEEKSEQELDGIRNAIRGNTSLFPEKYKQRFKHLRLKLYDTESRGIIDIHITNLLSKCIKDYCPGISHSQRSARSERELDKRYDKVSGKIKSSLDSFFERMNRLRGFKHEFDFHNLSLEERSSYLSISPYREIEKKFNNENQVKAIDEVIRNIPLSNSKKIYSFLKSVGIGTSELESFGRTSNLSVLIDLMFFQLTDILWNKPTDEIFLDTKLDAKMSCSLPSYLTELLSAANYSSKLHTLIYSDKAEGKDWKNRKERIDKINLYISHIVDKKIDINRIISSAPTSTEEYVNVFKNLCSITRINDPILNIASQRKTLKKLNRQVQLNIMEQIYLAYTTFLSNPNSKEAIRSIDVQENINEVYSTFERKFNVMHRDPYITEEQKIQYITSRDKFKEVYNQARQI